jgi:IclR family acetate operon transcriptional repressor
VSSRLAIRGKISPQKMPVAPKDLPLDRAIGVIERVIAMPGRLTVATLAAETHLPLPSIARLVTQLEARGMIRRAFGTRHLSPGPRLMGIGLDASRASFTGDAAHLLLVGLAARLGEHCQIGVVSGPEVIYVDSARSARGASMQFEPGERVPIHCTSTGKLFLAELDDAPMSGFLGSRPLRRYTPSTVTDPATLIAQVREARRRGWAATNGEYVTGVVGCAVPIRDGKGAMLASLAIAVPEARSAFNALHRFVPVMRDAAKAIREAIESSRATR